MEIPINNDTLKFCRKGMHIVEKSQFTTDKNLKDGLRSACKQCIHKKNTKYYKNKKLQIQTFLENDAEKVMQE